MEIKSMEEIIEKNRCYILEDGLISEIREKSNRLHSVTKAILNGEDVNIDEKYIVPELEGLSVAVYNLLSSGYGMFIMNYVWKTSINHLSYGFKTGEELKAYANWTIEHFNDKYKGIEEKIKDMKKIEKKLSKSDLAEKYIAQKEAEMNIFKNIFDFEGKKKYCDQAREFETINSLLENLTKVHRLIEPIYMEMQEIS